MAATFASYVLTQNLATTATITHFIIYNWDDLKSAWSFIAWDNLKSLAKLSTWKFWEKSKPTQEHMEKMDPHYKLMILYKECPDWWFGAVWLISATVGLICIYEANSGMTWWAFIIANLLACILILFTGAQFGITGFRISVQPVIQMIGAYLQPGNPLANMLVSSILSVMLN